MKKKIVLSVSLAAFLSTTLLAKDNYALEEVSITEQVPSRSVSQNEAFSAPESSKLTIDTITKEKMNIANPKNIFEAINQTAGANIQFQGRKNSSIITFRGSPNAYSSSAFSVILDGALLSPMSSLRILEALSLDLVDSIEVIRDASALTLGPIAGFGTPNGSPALGFIVIKTKLPRKNEGYAKFAYETFDTKKIDLSYGGIHENIFYMASVNGFKTDGKKDFNTAEETGSVFLRSGYIGDTFSATISAYYAHIEKEIQTGTISDSKVSGGKWKYEPMENRFISAIFEKDFDSNNKTTLQFAHSQTDWKHDQDTRLPNPKKEYFVGKQSSESIDLRHALKIGDTIIKAGAQAMFYNAPDGELFYEGIQRKEQLYGAFLHASHALDENKLILDASVRVDKKHIDNSVERYDPDTKVRPDFTHMNPQQQIPSGNINIIKDTWAKDSIALSLGALYKVSDDIETTARFAYLTSGTAAESKSADGSNMKDESHLRYELGAKYTANKYFSPTLNLFFYDTNNIKSPVYGGTTKNPEIYFNQMNQNRYGGELGFDGRGDSFYYSMSYAHATANEKKNEIPKHIVSALAQKEIGVFALNASAKYISTYQSNFFTPKDPVTKQNVYRDIGDYVNINLSIDYNHKLFNNDAKFTVYGRNILDKNFMTVYAFEDQGSVFGASYGFKF